MHCAHCGTQVPPARAQAIRTAPRWQDPTHAPITCMGCQRAIDHAARTLALGSEPTTPVPEPPSVDSRGLPDYSGPVAPAPAPPRSGPDTVCWPVTVSHAANSRIDATPYQLGDGSHTLDTDRESPGLDATIRSEIRDSLAKVGIVSLASWRALAHARGKVGQERRRAARVQVEHLLRKPSVTDWLAATHRAEHEHEADPGQVTGDAILPGVEASVEALDAGLEYMDPDGTPEAQRRPAESLAHVSQSPSALDSGTRQRQRERVRYRAEHSLARQWERYPSGTPRGAVEVTDLDGVPVRTDLPPWPEPAPSKAEPSNPAEPTADRKARKAESARRSRARARAAKTVAAAAQSGDVARLAAAQRAAGRQVSAAVSSHPWE